jgi:hypothetical protein
MIWIFPRSKVSKVGALRRFQASKKRREEKKYRRPEEAKSSILPLYFFLAVISSISQKARPILFMDSLLPN